jgi:hypothetical protein
VSRLNIAARLVERKDGPNLQERTMRFIPAAGLLLAVATSPAVAQSGQGTTQCRGAGHPGDAEFRPVAGRRMGAAPDLPVGAATGRHTRPLLTQHERQDRDGDAAGTGSRDDRAAAGTDGSCAGRVKRQWGVGSGGCMVSVSVHTPPPTPHSHCRADGQRSPAHDGPRLRDGPLS